MVGHDRLAPWSSLLGSLETTIGREAPGGGGGAGTPGGPYVVTITGTSSNPANPPQTVQFPFTTN